MRDRRVVRRRAVCVSALIVGSCACVAGDLFTVDVEADRLVRMDDTTGVVTPVGPLGVDMGNVELAWSGGVLYMLSSGNGGFPVRLYEIDTATGAATALPEFAIPGNIIEVAEGLAADADGLIGVFDTEPGNSVRSGTFGRIDPSTGVVTPMGTVPSDALLDGGDLDGFTYDATGGRFLGFDGNVVPIGGTAIAEADPVTGEVAQVAFIDASTAIGYLVHAMVEGDTLIATTIDNTGGTAGALLRASRDGTGWSVDSVLPLGPTGRYFGTVRARPGCNAADVAPPFGLLDLADVTAFTQAFVAMDPLGDLDGSGLLDLADVNLFVSAFLAGCP
jgi:hypothetical protein